jgi:hypothetical protein
MLARDEARVPTAADPWSAYPRTRGRTCDAAIEPGESTWRGPGNPIGDQQLDAATALADVWLPWRIPTIRLTSPSGHRHRAAPNAGAARITTDQRGLLA